MLLIVIGQLKKDWVVIGQNIDIIGTDHPLVTLDTEGNIIVSPQTSVTSLFLMFLIFPALSHHHQEDSLTSIIPVALVTTLITPITHHQLEQLHQLSHQPHPAQPWLPMSSLSMVMVDLMVTLLNTDRWDQETLTTWVLSNPLLRINTWVTRAPHTSLTIILQQLIINHPQEALNHSLNRTQPYFHLLLWYVHLY